MMGMAGSFEAYYRCNQGASGVDRDPDQDSVRFDPIAGLPTPLLGTTILIVRPR